MESAKIEKYHIKANASFAIREGWLTKGLRHVHDQEDIFLRDDAIDQLGIGSAMVKSLRYWMQAAGLSTEPKVGKRTQTLTALGNLIYENDLYFEDDFTLCLIHYHIVSNPEMATVWYLLFNHYSATRFTKDVMTEALYQTFREMTSKDVAISSFKDDCGTALRTYVTDETQSASPEENMQCPLAALGLFTHTARNTYEATIPSESRLHAQAVLYVLLDRMKGRGSISIDKLLVEPCNVAKVFHLNPYRLNCYLDELQAGGHLSIQRTAGLNIVTPTTSLSAIEVAEDYYRR